MRSIPLLASLILFPLPAFAEGPAFQDSILISTMHYASSQSYLIKKQSCEIASTFSRGNLVSKTIDLTLEGKSQGAAFHCGQSLEQNSLVIGIKAGIEQFVMDGVIVRFEDLTTQYEPYLAFQLSPSFSLGVSEEVSHGENKSLRGNASVSTHRLMVSGTWHEGPWEATLSYGDRYRNPIASSIDIPRSIGFSARHMFSPLLTAGIIYVKTDYPGVASGDDEADLEHTFAGVITSQLSEDFNIELSHMIVVNSEGDDDAKVSITGVAGQYNINSEVRINGFLNQYKGDDKAFDTSMSSFGVGFSLNR